MLGIQKNLQEKLIAVETQSFSGKMQILRNMLAEKAKELDTVLHKQNIGNANATFKKFLSFKGLSDFGIEKNETDKKKSGFLVIIYNLKK